MTETKITHTAGFTPGDWQVDPEEPCNIILADGFLLARTIQGHSKAKATANAEANARLMAASKRLYEALKEIKCWIPSTGKTAAENGCKCDTLGEAFELMEQALAAADRKGGA